MIPAQPTSSQISRSYSRYPASTVIELKLKDTVSPEFLQYHFKRFGFNVIDYELEQVEAVIKKKMSEKLLLQIAEHPFIDKISVMESSVSDSVETKIRFNHHVSDEMITAFLRIHSGLHIHLLPRVEKKAILKMQTWRSDLAVQHLEMIIYVEKAKVLSLYTLKP